ncbi:MAG TPA: 1-deoxy-D-xylulose-5-phosphate reductoisomerase [Lachnospiraceae bacterium]|nr:1-deoxy-D-xylulose-5-phosphate reductoisomerase [Lachnospiraceae bacterium]
MKKIAILGSTGSIGTQTLNIVRNNSELKVTALAAGRNIKLLETQAREFKPDIVAVYDPEGRRELSLRLKDTDIKVLGGMDGLIEAAAFSDAQILVTAVVGMIGIRPTIAAIEEGKDIALANKETLVTAGHIIIPLAQKKGVRLLPVDSEHSAIFQSLQGEPRDAVESIILTASGGPFRGRSTEQLKSVTVKDALMHPNWSMGKKITVDSATMVNKGLEVMEAKWLFDVPIDKIRVVVHPQSIIHSAVEFVDGAVIAQLGMPDMGLPIQYALFYPDRKPLNTKRLRLTEIRELTFEEPDPRTFKGFGLAMKAAKAGGSLPTVFNAANEEAVAMFLNGKAGFLEIADIIEYCMEKHRIIEDPSVDDILSVEEETRRMAEKAGRAV